jgi:hypothetical protein
MDEVKSTDSVPSVPVGERAAADAAPPSSMNDLEALDMVKVPPFFAFCSALHDVVCLIAAIRF